MEINKIWSEKYRPQTIDDCILPDRIKNIFKSYKEKDNIPSMILSGSSGCGKTTIARALCKELNVECMEINGSDENGIDVLRTKITDYVSSYSLVNEKPYKVILLDEADGLTPQMQDGLRNFIEKYSDYCRFIFTCNNFYKLTDAIKSRTVHIPFDFTNEEKNKLLFDMSKRISTILSNEKRNTDITVIGRVVLETFPDFRNAINTLENIDGNDYKEFKKSIDANGFKDLIEIMKNKDFTKMVTWVEENCKSNEDILFSKIYDNISTIIQGPKKCQAILDLADYQQKFYFAKDKRITLCACIVKLSTLI